MAGPADGSDDRAVSELTSVLTLVVFALAVVVAVGANVVLVSDTGTDHPDAVFDFDYTQDQQSLLVTHAGGDEIKAGHLVFRGPNARATWAQLDQTVDNETLIGLDNITVLNRRNAYDARVRPSHRVSVLYVNTSANQTAVLSQWNGTG